MQRVVLTLASILTMWGAYGLYELTVVAQVEPTVTLPGKVDPESDPANLLAGELDPVEKLRGRLKRWFPYDAWEVNQASKILETSQGILVLQHYENRTDGTVRLWPCSMVFLPDGQDDPPDGKQQPVILQAPQGAILRFDRPMDLRTGTIGRLTGGRLNGRVIVRSGMKRKSEDDDLTLVTSEVALTDSTLTTDQEVRYTLGTSRGIGQGMIVELIPAAGGSANQPSFQGVRSLELQRQVRMFLDLNNRLFADPQANAEPEDITQEKPPASPLNVQSEGPFRFNVELGKASFEQAVLLQRPNPGGTPDQLSCDVLTLLFHESGRGTMEVAPPADPLAGETPPPTGSFVFRELEATGKLVAADLPNQKLRVDCQVLRWNEITGWLVLQAGPNQLVTTVQEANEINAPEIQVQLDRKTQQLNQATATGPGRMRVKQTDRSVLAQWTEKLEVRPDGPMQLISLIGGAGVDAVESGQVQAETIRLWMEPDPLAAPRPEGSSQPMRPRNVKAVRNVRVRSPLLTAQMEQADLWFEHGGPFRGEPKPAPVQPISDDGVETIPPPAPVGPPPPPAEPEPKRTFDVEARQVVARLRVEDGGQAQVLNIRAEGNVRIVETPSAAGQSAPMVLLGQLLVADNANPLASTAQVTGAPAKVEGQGMSLEGGKINLDRGENRLWINGPGVLTLLVQNSEDGQEKLAREPLEVRWQGGMHFDGQIAHFDSEVDARLGPRALRTEVLEVTMSERIDFANPKRPDNGPEGPRTEVARIACPRQFFMRSETFKSGRKESIERVSGRNLLIDQRTGAVFAEGPGWLEQVARGSGGAMALGPTAQPASTAPPAAGPNLSAEMTFLHVAFGQEVTGNFRTRGFRFLRQVEVTHGPVEKWDDVVSRDALGLKGMWLRCEQLDVRQVVLRNEASAELEARDNVQVEGNEFKARAERLSYSQDKDLLVLEGDGRHDAEVFQQQRANGPVSRLAALKIYFWRTEGRFKFEGVQQLDARE
jgi:hypothetical protein